MQEEREEMQEQDWSEPDCEPIEPEKSLLWRFLTRSVIFVGGPLCLLALCVLFIVSDGKLGVQGSNPAPITDTYVGFYLLVAEGKETEVWFGAEFDRTLSASKKRLTAKVPLSSVRYEVDPLIEGIAVSVTPTFWSRLVEPTIFFDAKEATIYVSNKKEEGLVAEFLAQQDDISFGLFKWNKEIEHKREEFQKEFKSLLRYYEYQLGKRLMDIAQRNGYHGFSVQEACDFLFQTAINIETHERIHGSDWDTLLVFDGVKDQCPDLIYMYMSGGAK